MAQSWGAASRLLAKDVRKEEREIAEAGRKAGLAGSFGSFLGGLIAMPLTGGTVNPITAGLITGGATAGGGLLGKQLFTGRKTKETLAGKRGKFLMGDRAELSDMLTSDIIKSGITAGASAGITQYGQNIKDKLPWHGKTLKDSPLLNQTPLETQMPFVPQGQDNIIGASSGEIAKTKDNIRKIMADRRDHIMEGSLHKNMTTFETPDVPNITSGSSSVVTGSSPTGVLDDYREKYFKRFGRYPEEGLSGGRFK